MSWTKKELDFLIKWRQWVDGERKYYPWREAEELWKEREEKGGEEE